METLFDALVSGLNYELDTLVDGRMYGTWEEDCDGDELSIAAWALGVENIQTHWESGIYWHEGDEVPPMDLEVLAKAMNHIEATHPWHPHFKK